MAGVPVPATIQQRQIAHFAKADPRYGAEVARKLQEKRGGAAVTVAKAAA